MPTSPQDLAERSVNLMWTQDGFSAWLGIKILSVSPGTCTVQMTIRPEMLNGFKKSHGGVVFSLADSAMAFAANTHGEISVAIDNQASYPAPVSEGDVVTAIAEEDSRTNKLGFYSVRVRNQDGVLVCLFRGTVYRTGKRFF